MSFRRRDAELVSLDKLGALAALDFAVALGQFSTRRDGPGTIVEAMDVVRRETLRDLRSDDLQPAPWVVKQMIDRKERR